jgi:hypothetical protein
VFRARVLSELGQALMGIRTPRAYALFVNRDRAPTKLGVIVHVCLESKFFFAPEGQEPRLESDNYRNTGARILTPGFRTQNLIKTDNIFLVHFEISSLPHLREDTASQRPIAFSSERDVLSVHAYFAYAERRLDAAQRDETSVSYRECGGDCT